MDKLLILFPLLLFKYTSGIGMRFPSISVTVDSPDLSSSYAIICRQKPMFGAITKRIVEVSHIKI